MNCEAVKASLPQDPVIAVYKGDVDRSLLLANLRLTPAQRLEKAVAALRMVSGLRNAKIRKPASASA